jgi:hypothetical protein
MCELFAFAVMLFISLVKDKSLLIVTPKYFEASVEFSY